MAQTIMKQEALHSTKKCADIKIENKYQTQNIKYTKAVYTSSQQWPMLHGSEMMETIETATNQFINQCLRRIGKWYARTSTNTELVEFFLNYKSED